MSWFKKKKPANTPKTKVDTIIGQMNEPRPLPLGAQEFDDWVDRILSGSLLPCEDKESMTFALGSMLMHLGPQESHKPDAFFIHSLRKSAVNQVAHAKVSEIKTRHDAKKKEEKDKADAEAASKATNEVSPGAPAENQPAGWP